MVKPIYLVLGAVPIIAALLISVPLIIKNEIPITAASSIDKIEIEYTKTPIKENLLWCDPKELVHKRLKFFPSKTMET